MYEEVLHFCVIEMNGKVVRTFRGPVLQNRYDVGDVVLGEELGFDRRLETWRRATIDRGTFSLSWEGGRRLRTCRDKGRLEGCSLGVASRLFNLGRRAGCGILDWIKNFHENCVNGAGCTIDEIKRAWGGEAEYYQTICCGICESWYIHEASADLLRLRK